jgi:tRNA A37 threonylcarbamoyladenosine dehydratase
MGLCRLRVIDHDRIAAHNLSTQPWVQQDIGELKARVLANMLYRAVGARVEVKSTTLTTDNAGALLSGSTVVVDAFDNLPSRAAVGDAATEVLAQHVLDGSRRNFESTLRDLHLSTT